MTKKEMEARIDALERRVKELERGWTLEPNYYIPPVVSKTGIPLPDGVAEFWRGDGWRGWGI